MTKRLLTYFRRHHIALLALFVAIGGTSYAAAKLPSNSVATKQIKNGQVKKADLSKNSVTSQKVKDLTLQARDFAPGQLPAGPAGARGPAGPAGAQGKPGAAGAPATKLFAVSDGDGNVIASKGVTSQGQIAVQTGDYVVAFDRDVRQCARIATVGGATVGESGQPAFIVTELISPSVVRVVATGSTSPGIRQAHPFSLAVFC